MQWLVGMALAAVTAFVTTAITIDNSCPHCQLSSLAEPVPDAEENQAVSPQVDEEGPTVIQLRSETDRPIPVAKDRRSLNRLADALDWGWDSEVGRLIQTGEVILAPHGSRAELLEQDTFSSKIRFRDGAGGSHVGYMLSDSFSPQFVKIEQPE